MNSLTIVHTRQEPLSKEAREVWNPNASSGKVQFVHLPLIQTVLRSDRRTLEQLHQWSSRDGILFTSKNAVKGFAQAWTYDVGNGGSRKPCFLFGASTERAASELGFAPKRAPVHTGQAFATWCVQQPWFLERSRQLFWPCGQLAGNSMNDVFASHGHELLSVVCYDTVQAPLDESSWEPVLTSSDVVITLYSPSAARAFMECYHRLWSLNPYRIRFAAIGQTTSREVQALGLEVWCTAPEASDVSLLQTIRERTESDERRMI